MKLVSFSLFLDAPTPLRPKMPFGQRHVAINIYKMCKGQKIISIQGIFVSDRTTNMQFSGMQNKIYGSLVTIQYHTKCTNPLYPKFTSKKFSVYIFSCNLYLVITYVLILTKDMCSHPFISNCNL